MRRAALHRLAVMVMITSIALSACGKTIVSQPIKHPDRWPAVLSDFTFAWSAESGIDLLAQPAVSVRAYLESVVLAWAGGSNDYLYPGFDDAVEREKPSDYARYSLTLWPDLAHPWEVPSAGSRRQHILREASNGQSVSVVVCLWNWGVAEKKPDGRYATPGSWRGPLTGIGVERVNVAAPAQMPPPDTRPQKGPSRFPLTDVFGSWRIIGLLSDAAPSDTLGPGTQWPEYHQDLAACQALAPETVERREFLTTGEHPRSDFPTLPSEPGWPLETK